MPNEQGPAGNGPVETPPVEKPPNGKRPNAKRPIKHALPLWLLPIAGAVGIGALFYFGYAEELSVKVTLGLAAAAIASCVPGLLQINSKSLQTGGAIAVFVLVMFSDEIGRSFGPAAKIPGVSTHVKFSRDQMQYQSEIASAQFEISNENWTGAIEILNHAKQLNPSDPLALHMIGMVSFNNLKNYSTAAEAFEQGYKIGGPNKGRFAWNLALANDAIGDSESAKKWIDTAYHDTSRDDYPTQWDEIVYDRGLIHMIAWLREKDPHRDKNFEVAAQSFNAFLDHRPRSPHWAEYNLACLHAEAAQSELIKQSTQAKAAEHFDKFLHGIRAISDQDKLEANRKIARRVLSLNANDKEEKRGPLEPVECPAIKDAWDAAKGGGSWDENVQTTFPPDAVKKT
jgi:tetratricopeptide (TPR) repeat protein